MTLLRFLTCGSVDDGKSTLIGRLLFDAGVLPDDHRAALERDGMDFSRLLDGLEAEREQGITIDVAYRFFSTEKRSFIVADTPGHEHYTRNMVTGCSTSDLAVILVDAQKGVVEQTRRHARIASLLGIRHVVLAVNKMDCVGYTREAFDAVAGSLAPGVAIPVSARFGDNVCRRSERMPWYTGATLLEHLENVDVDTDTEAKPFRMPVQWVNRAEGFRGYSGTLAAGSIAPGEHVRVREGRTARVQRIVTYDGDLPRAVSGQAVTLVLEGDLDVSRGDVLADPSAPPIVSDELTAHVVWLAGSELVAGRYWLKLAAKTVSAQVTPLEGGLARVMLGEAIGCDTYETNRETGGFILIDRASFATVGAGMIASAIPVSNVRPQPLDVDQGVRAAMKAQRPVTVWFTGLPAAGKSTIANMVERALVARGRHTYLLDGDNLRRGLNRDLSFSARDRAENVRRTAETAKLLADAGLIVLVALVSPFAADRRAARALHEPKQFIEVFVDTPLDVCIARDPKGLYAKAAAGEIADFTGVGSPYEPPDAPDLVLRTAEHDAGTLAARVVALLDRYSETAT